MKINEMFEESDGKVSFSRVSCGLILFGWLVWVTYSVYKTATLPANMWEVGAPLSSVYGLNKIGNAIAGNKKDG